MATRKAPRRRRSSEEARTAILDAAERALRDVGPAGIRLQDVARQAGMSHPTVLHHFGSREGLLDAVVQRSLSTLQAGVFEAVRSGPGTAGVQLLLDGVASQLKDGRARSFLYLALAGFGPKGGWLQLEPLAQAVHEVRRQRCAAQGTRTPPFEDTWFTVMLPGLALLSLSVLDGKLDASFDVPKFRAWLGRLLHEHLNGAR